MSLFNTRRNKFSKNDGQTGFRLVDNYRNKNVTNDGKEGFRIVNNAKGDDKPQISTREIQGDNNGYSITRKLGYSVSINNSNNRIVAGAPLYNFFGPFPPQPRENKVFIYDLNGILVTQLTGEDYFGYSVAVNDKIAVGSLVNIVSIYDLNGVSLTQLTSDNSGFTFGYSLAMGNNKIIVGDPNYYDGDFNVGKVYIFNANSPYDQLTTLSYPFPEDVSYFGASVAINEVAGRIVVGAPYKSVGVNGFQGQVYVYDANSPYQLLTQLTAFDGSADQYYGYSVAVSDDKIIVGAYPDGGEGSVYIYDISGNFLAKLLSSDAENSFGASVSVSKNKLIVGVPYDTIGSNTDQGSSYIYNISLMPPTLIKKIVKNAGLIGDTLGYSVAIDGTVAVIGAPKQNAETGFITIVENIL